jgi:hypothetical protein
VKKDSMDRSLIALTGRAKGKRSEVKAAVG